jgi:hypothetical protein
MEQVHRSARGLVALAPQASWSGTPSRPRWIVALRPRLKMRLRADGVYNTAPGRSTAALIVERHPL